MGEKTIIIQSIVGRSDYNSLRAYHMYKRNPKRTKRIVYILVLSLGLLVISETAFAFPFLKVIGLTGIFVITILYFLLSMDARRLEKSGRDIVNQKQEICLSENGLSAKWQTSEKKEYAWANISYAVESDTHFFLFVDQYFAIIIPKLELKDYKIKEIHKLLESHVDLVSDTSGFKAHGI